MAGGFARYDICGGASGSRFRTAFEHASQSSVRIRIHDRQCTEYLAAMSKYLQRPPCPKCGMNMIATAPVKNSQQPFECLRCGHKETRRTATTMYRAGDHAQPI
jgi:predicted RNA-binding Zn-ribbon protein involved in translation (DUF1610 family)